MIFTPTRVAGACIVDLEPKTDERGFFARAWCAREFEAQGLPARVAQINHSFNERQGTLRGMHFQAPPFEEAKVVSCAQGALFDVVLDLRSDSPTFGCWEAVELTPENGRMLFIPAGCAHGFQTLVDRTQALYFMSEFYVPGQACGVRFDDPAFGIEWPLPVSCLSDADRRWPLYEVNGSRIPEAIG